MGTKKYNVSVYDKRKKELCFMFTIEVPEQKGLSYYLIEQKDKKIRMHNAIQILNIDYNIKFNPSLYKLKFKELEN